MYFTSNELLTKKWFYIRNIYVYKQMAVTFVVDGPSLDIAPDNWYSIFLDRTVRLAMYGKPGTHCYVTASATILWWGNLIQHWVIGIVGRFHKSGTQSSIWLQTWSIVSGRITK
jgi:hypothetical protein